MKSHNTAYKSAVVLVLAATVIGSIIAHFQPQGIALECLDPHRVLHGAMGGVGIVVLVGRPMGLFLS